MLIVGTIIGAGLASGQEIVVFFAQYGFVSLFFLIAVFALFYFGFREFLCFGKNCYEIDFKKNKVFAIFDGFSFFIFIAISSAMLAGANALFSQYVFDFHFPLWSIILICISTLIGYFGIKGLLNLSIYLVPVMIVGIVYICIKGSTVSTLSAPAFSTDLSNLVLLSLSTVGYCCCNLVTANKVLFESGEGLSKKQIKLISVVSAIILTLLIGTVIVSILINDEMVLFSTMPLIYLAFLISNWTGVAFSIILFLSVTTTLFTSQYSLSRILEEKLKKRKKIFSSLISLIIIFLTSLLGFNDIIKYVYPIIGGFGFVMLFILRNLTLKLCFNSANNEIHSAGKNAKQESACHNKVKFENRSSINN